MPPRRLVQRQEHQRQGGACQRSHERHAARLQQRPQDRLAHIDWDSQYALADFAINNTASTLGDVLTPFFIDRGAHPRLPLSPPHHDLAAGESPAHYAQRMRAMELKLLQLLAAAEADR